MWDFLGKKSGTNSGKILNEREIQEKLYGKYRAPSKERNSPPQKSNSQFVLNSSASIAQVAEPEVASPVTPDIRWTDSAKKRITPITNPTTYNKLDAKTGVNENLKIFKILSNSLTQKIFGTTIVAIIVILGAQKLWIHLQAKHSTRLDSSFLIPTSPAQNKLNSETRTSALTQAGNDNQSANTVHAPAEYNSREVTVKPLQPSRREGDLKENELVNVTSGTETAAKPFAVQICTYRLESDARNLASRLQDENLPAFYEPSTVKSGKAPKFFIVYTERAASYQEAQAGLMKFKKSISAKDFPDAFVRKL